MVLSTTLSGGGDGVMSEASRSAIERTCDAGISDVLACLREPQFTQTIAGKAPLVMRGVRRGFAELFDWRDVSEVLAVGEFVPGREVRFIKEQVDVPMEEFSRQVHWLDNTRERALLPDQCRALLQAGNTLTVRRI